MSQAGVSDDGIQLAASETGGDADFPHVVGRVSSGTEDCELEVGAVCEKRKPMYVKEVGGVRSVADFDVGEWSRTFSIEVENFGAC